MLSPISIPFLAYIVAPDIPTLFPIFIFASFVLVTIIVLEYNPTKFDKKLLFIVTLSPKVISAPFLLNITGTPFSNNFLPYFIFINFNKTLYQLQFILTPVFFQNLFY